MYSRWLRTGVILEDDDLGDGLMVFLPTGLARHARHMSDQLV